MKSFERGRVRSLAYTNSLVSSIRLLGEFKGKGALFARQTPQALETLRLTAIIESAESSNRIEGVTASRERVQALVTGSAKPANRSEAEIAGYRDVLSTIHASHQAIVVAPRARSGRTAFSPNVVLQFHRDLFRQTPARGGRWKSTDSVISETRPDGSRFVRFQPVRAHEVKRHMDTLHGGLAAEWSAADVDPLILTPAYVLDFLCVHPFLDGNGRMARLLTLLLLYKAGYGVGKYISLERLVEQSKESYYETLYRSSQGWHTEEHDLVPWTEYFIGVLIAAYREFEDRVREITGARGAKTAMVEHAVRSLPPSFRISQVEQLAPTVSRDLIRRVLRRLKREGAVRSEGAGTAAVWVKSGSSAAAGTARRTTRRG